MHPFSIPRKIYGFPMFSRVRERVHWEQLDEACRITTLVVLAEEFILKNYVQFF